MLSVLKMHGTHLLLMLKYSSTQDRNISVWIVLVWAFVQFTWSSTSHLCLLMFPLRALLMPWGSCLNEYGLRFASRSQIMCHAQHSLHSRRQTWCMILTGLIVPSYLLITPIGDEDFRHHYPETAATKYYHSHTRHKEMPMSVIYYSLCNFPRSVFTLDSTISSASLSSPHRHFAHHESFPARFTLHGNHSNHLWFSWWDIVRFHGHHLWLSGWDMVSLVIIFYITFRSDANMRTQHMIWESDEYLGFHTSGKMSSWVK